MKTYNELILATFGERLIARFIDSIILGTLGFLLVSTFFLHSESFIGAYFLIVQLIYYPIFECNGGTIGKRVIGIRPANMNNGETPNFNSTFKRALFVVSPIFIGGILLALFFFIDSNYKNAFILIQIFEGAIIFFALFISPLAVSWTKLNQGWHDWFSDIIVVKNKSIENESGDTKPEFIFECIHCGFEKDSEFEFCPKCYKNDDGFTMDELKLILLKKTMKELNLSNDKVEKKKIPIKKILFIILPSIYIFLFYLTRKEYYPYNYVTGYSRTSNGYSRIFWLDLNFNLFGERIPADNTYFVFAIFLYISYGILLLMIYKYRKYIIEKIIP